MSVRPSNTGPTSPAKQSLVANLALLGGGIVVALLFAEVALRIYNPLPMPLRGNNQVLPKSVVLQREVPYPKDGKLLERFEVRTNQLGFRGPELPEPREGRPTIFFVGGSTTEGRYIPDEHAWPLVATATLAHEFPGLWGNNAGLEGNSSHGHKLLLEHVILPLRPRFVVFLVGVNEIWVTDPQEFDGQTAKGLLWKKLEFSELLSTLTVLYRSMRARDAGLVSFDGLNLPQRTSQVIDPAGIDKALAAHRDRGAPRAYEQRLRDLLAMTRAAGAEPILLTQPALFGSGVDPTTGLELGPLVAEGPGTRPGRASMRRCAGPCSSCTTTSLGPWQPTLARRWWSWRVSCPRTHRTMSTGSTTPTPAHAPWRTWWRAGCAHLAREAGWALSHTARESATSAAARSSA
jgi:lysophospholipase L1-like esterase